MAAGSETSKHAGSAAAEPGARRRFRAVGARAAVVALLLVVAGVLGAAPAGAHASLLATDPVADLTLAEPPDEVILTFDEAVSVELGSGVRVFGPDGERVDRNVVRFEDEDRQVVAPLDDGGGRGTYTVAWKVVSEDSHVLSGSFVYHVQVETGPAAVGDGTGLDGLDVVAWGARWLILAGGTALAGAAILRVVVRGSGGLASARARRYVVAAAAALVAGAGLRLVAQVAAASGRSLFSAVGLVGEAVSDTRAGRLDAVRIVAAVVGLAGALAWRRGRAAVFVALAGAAGVMVVNALSGHAFTSDRPSLAVLSDVVHQYAVAIWVGGLAAVAVLSRTTEPEGRYLLRTFSRLALAGLVVVVATGLVSAWDEVASLGALRSTTYGRVLVTKVGVVAIMAGFGWWNRGRLREMGERFGELMATVRAEALLAVVALGLTAALVGLVPAREQPTEPFTGTRSDAAGLVTLSVAPAQPGANSLHLYFFDEAGQPRAVDAAEARVQQGDVPPRRVDLVPIRPDHYSASGVSLPQAGRWRVSVTTISRGTPSETTFEVPVR